MDTAVQDVLIGRLVDGRYRVRARIARGGMATVYEAADQRLDRDVALKVMHPDLADDEEFVQRFIAEARSAAALSRDQTIVTVFDQGASDGVVWLALELVRGHTLRQLITERGRLDPRTAMAVMEPVLTALTAAHDAGIVHRDVKPENVLIGDDGHIQVADFGLAHAVTNAPQAAHGTATRGMLLGTVAYISPEQALGHPATQASDVYAAGVLLFELLTGHPPHDGPTDYVIVRKHVDEDVPLPSTFVDGIPAEVDMLVQRATARQVPERFGDAGAFLGAVRRTRRMLEPPAPGSAGTPALDLVLAVGAVGGHTSDTNPIHHSTTSMDALPEVSAPEVSADADSAPDDAGGRTGNRPTVPPSEVPVSGSPGDPFATPPRPARRKRRIRRLVLTVLVLAGLGAGAWFWFEGRLVDAPALVGMTVAEAQQAADAAGLAVAVDGTEYSETIPADAVVTTDPAGGVRLPPGSSIALVLSLGPERYEVPDLAGTQQDAAQEALAELTLVPGEVTETFSEDVPQGQVISQDPAPGTEVRRSAPVSFVVSKGREPIDVPSVTGAGRDDAVGSLESAGLTAAISEEFSTEVERGLVISQEPADGTLFRGDPVSIVVSLGPETIQVPDVEGADADAARADLEAAGLTVRSIVLLPAGPNNVLRQAPAEGSTVRVGSEVTIYIF